VTIMNGARAHALLLELFTVRGIGTEVLLDETK
jgi:acetylglutamate kinase